MVAQSLAGLEQEYAGLARRRDAALAELKGAEEGCQKDEASLTSAREREDAADSELNRASNAFDALEDGELRQLHLLLVQAASTVREIPAQELEQTRNIKNASRAVGQTFELLHCILSQTSNSSSDLAAQVKRTVDRPDLISAIANYDSSELLSGRAATVVGTLWDRYLGGERGAGGYFAQQQQQWRHICEASAQRKTEIATSPVSQRTSAMQPQMRRMGTWHGRTAVADPSTGSSFASTSSTVLGHTGLRGAVADAKMTRTQSLSTHVRTFLPKIKGAFSMRDVKKEPPPSALSVDEIGWEDEVAGRFFWWCLCQLMYVSMKAKAPSNISQQATYLEQRIESLERELEGLKGEAAACEARVARSREAVAEGREVVAALNGQIYQMEEELRRARELERKNQVEAARIRLEEEERERLRLEREEEERLAREEREEVERLAREERERAEEEARRKEREAREAREEEERLAREERERAADEERKRERKEKQEKEERERAEKAKEEAERKAKEEAERKEKERKQAEKKAKAEAERKEAVAAFKRDKEEKERKAKEERDEKEKEKQAVLKKQMSERALIAQQQKEEKDRERMEREREERERKEKEEARLQKEKQKRALQMKAEKERREQEIREKKEKEEALRHQQGEREKKAVLKKAASAKKLTVESQEREKAREKREQERLEKERERQEEEERAREREKADKAKREKERQDRAERERREREGREAREAELKAKRETEDAERLARAERERRRREASKKRVWAGEEFTVDVTRTELEVPQRIYFREGDDRIEERFIVDLGCVVQFCKEHPDIKILVEGHGDRSEGWSEVNSIANRRATAVHDHLVARGVPLSQIRSEGFGRAFSERWPYNSRGRRGRAGLGTRMTNLAPFRFWGASEKESECESESKNMRVAFSVIQEVKMPGTIFFAPMSVDIHEASRPLLEHVVQLLSDWPLLHVRVEGHTCSAPSYGVSNLALSDGRARAVVEALREVGIDESRLQAKGCGDERPLHSNDSDRGKKLNRRVEFHILSRECERMVRDLHSSTVTSPAALKALANDTRTMQSLRELAGGAGGSTCRHVRRAAADLLLRCGAEWDIVRLFWIAMLKRGDSSAPPLTGKGGPRGGLARGGSVRRTAAGGKDKDGACPLVRLDRDVVRMIMQWYLMLG